MRLPCAALLAAFVATAAHAAPSIESTTSVLFFPKVVADGMRDTTLLVGNGSNSFVHARCFYLDAALSDPSQPSGPENLPRWTKTEFEISLTKQHTTSWVVSRGREVDATDPPCSPEKSDCYAAGIDPGTIPAPTAGFQGALLCVETDETGAPISGNHLFGSASLQDLASGDVAGYSAVGLQGFETNNGDSTLCLGGPVSEICPTGTEYEGCPQNWYFNHVTSGAPDAAQSGGSVYSSFSALPCTWNLNDAPPPAASLQVVLFNEQEQRFNTSTSLTFWTDRPMTDIDTRPGPSDDDRSLFTFAALQSPTALTKLRALTSGVVMVGEEEYVAAGDERATATTATNLHFDGVLNTSDLIILPASEAP
jgi:hypothetical protein